MEIMGELVPANEISEEDYLAIQEAVMETARGRWFLAEYARRNRVSDTDKVLNAIDEVKTYITREHEPIDVMQMRLNIVDMTQKIEQIKTEIANTDHSSPNIADAQIELHVVLDETETATSTILTSAEEIQGLGWEIRERGGFDAECDKIDEFATEIYMACSFQDLTGQRLRKVVQLIEMLETRLKAMVSLWDESELERYRDAPKPRDEISALTNGPATPEFAQGQDQIDNVMGEIQGINVNDMRFDDIQWSDDDSEMVSDAPFIIDDDEDDKGFLAASAPEGDPVTGNEAHDIAAFEADASDERFEPEREGEEEARREEKFEPAPSRSDARALSYPGEENTLDEMAPLPERIAAFS